MEPYLRRVQLGALVVVVAASLVLACTSQGGSCASPGGPVSGPPDDHCAAPDGGAVVRVVSQAACHPAASPDGGATTDYGPTLDNASGDDDDCKYHVAWTSTPVCEASGVVFTVVATTKADGSPLAGAAMMAEIFASPTHPSPTPLVESAEGPPGTYVTQPVLFDAPGDWTVRFHFFDACEDLTPDSPHAHAAFYVRVP